MAKRKRRSGPNITWVASVKAFQLSFSLPINKDGRYYQRGDGKSFRLEKRSKQRTSLEAMVPEARKLIERAHARIADLGDIEQWISMGLLRPAHAEVIFEGYRVAINLRGNSSRIDFDRLQELYNDFILDRENLRDPTRATHHNHINMAAQVIKWLKGNHPNLDLTPRDIDKYIEGQRDRFSTSTVNKRLVKLRQLLDLAVGDGMILTNPSKAAAAKIRPEDGSRRRRLLSADEVKLILNRMKEKAYLYESAVVVPGRKIPIMGCLPIAFRLGIYAGLRNEEIRWLTWDAIDLKEGSGSTLSIERTQCDKTGRVWVPKSKLQRTIGVNRALRKALLDHKQRLADLEITGQFVVPGGGLTRNRYGGSIIGEKALTRSFREFVENEADLDLAKPAPTFYSVRHTFATELLRSGTETGRINIVDVQARMGHKDINTTKIYADALEPESGLEEDLPY